MSEIKTKREGGVGYRPDEHENLPEAAGEANPSDESTSEHPVTVEAENAH